MKIDRRRVLQTTAAVLTAGSLATLAQTAEALTLVDTTLSQRELRAAGRVASADHKPIQPDLVRQWRDGLGAQIVSADAVTAYVRWDKALLLVGLAREARMAYRTVQLSRAVFAVRISRLR